MRTVYSIKYYKDEGFVERIIELNDEELTAIVEDHLIAHGDFDFDEIELANNHPMHWLRAKCRTYIDPDNPDETEDEQVSKAEAEVVVSGKYDDRQPEQEPDRAPSRLSVKPVQEVLIGGRSVTNGGKTRT
jgi:hypothetical protein